MSTETKFCLTSDEELIDDQTIPVVVAILIIFNIVGILGVSILIFFETRTKLKYHRVKETPPKLVLTREYLEKLRPPKRSTPAVDPNTIPSIPSIPSTTTNDAAAAGGNAAATAATSGTTKEGTKESAAAQTNLNDPTLEQTQEQKTKTEDKKK